MLHALGAPVRILVVCGFTVLAAGALGRWFLRACGAWRIFTRGERPVLAFAMGSAWLSSAVFALCAAQLLYKPTLVIIGAAALWIGFRGGAHPPAEPPGAAERPSWLLAAVLGVAAACYLYLYLINALAPEISPDGASYHLALVARYLRERGFSRFTTSLYAMLSQGMEMLFVFSFAFGRYSAAKVTHFAFLVATAAAMVVFGRRFRLGTGCAAVAAAFFAFSPVVGVDGTSSYNDCALALFTFLTFYLLLLWDEKREAALLAPIGVAAGFCYAIKYTGFLAVPLALGWVLWKSRSWRAVLRVALVASLFIVPWMVKDAIVVGNPVAPFFNRFFPNPYVHVSFEKIYTFFMRHYGGIAEHNWSDYKRVPWELTVVGAKLQGLLGPLFLLAPLGLWSLRQKMGRGLWAAAALFALPWFTNVGTRFLIPSLVFVSLAMALAIWQAPRRMAVGISVSLVIAHAAGCWPSVISRWNHKQPWALEGVPWRAALRIEPEEEYLGRVLPDYNVARMIERAVPPAAKVFSPEAISDAYTSRTVIVSYQSALGEILMDDLLTPVLHDFGPVWNIRFGWQPRELTGLRLVQTGSDGLEQWSIHEMLLFDGAHYIVPKSSWRLRARPSGWDAALAMDGNPATRWRSWWPLYPGMQYEVDFPEPLRLSAVELHCSSDQLQLRLRVEGRVDGQEGREDQAGQWMPLDAPMRRSDREPDRLAMKRLATIDLKRRGIDYLLTNLEGSGMNLIAPDIARDPAAWGVRQVAEYGPMRLYRIL